jgi:superfamily II DNA or RNA helicase
MITRALIEDFVAAAGAQPRREGRRYAETGRVGALVGTGAGVTTVVQGRDEDFEVALWSEDGAFAHRCSCPSWRDPCKHQVAAALALAETLGEPGGGQHKAAALLAKAAAVDPPEARREALAERQAAAASEPLSVRRAEPPVVTVRSGSGFTYRVTLRGDADGPHGCECPDFLANRLHTCKHVERVRRWLSGRRTRLPSAFRAAMQRPRVYLHHGEIIEPRLLGRPRGRGAQRVRAAFDGSGRPLAPLNREPEALLAQLERLGDHVEREALDRLRAEAARRPRLAADWRSRLAEDLARRALEPFDYQWEGVEFLARSGRALLADEMGLGKTIQALLAARVLAEAEQPARHVTVVCPASLRSGWEQEIARWLGEQAVLLDGRAHQRAQTIAARPAWLITHYEQLLRDHEHHRAHPPDLLIVDEAQRVKSLGARTARLLKSIETPYLFALTGTPLENRLEEAYAIAQLVDQRLLPPLWQIDRDHFVRGEGGRRVVMYRQLDALRARLAPAFLRRRKEDVALELPERLRSVSLVPLHPAVRGTYQDLITQVARIANRKVIPPAELERMQRLLVIARRCCNGPHMLGLEVEDRHVPKLAELAQALRELCCGEQRKAVVFSEWTDMTHRAVGLAEELGLPTFHLHGGVPVRRRPALLRGFAETEGGAVFVSTDAGGLGLNLQAAEVVINLDLPWNPARLEQRLSRVHRIGSTRPVHALLLVTRNSLEERILGLHGTKRDVLESVWGSAREDVIAAPGGSGAFREMVRSLIDPVPSTEPVRAAPPAAQLEAAAAAPPATGVDAAALTAAVAAIAPILPPDQRRSLAVVFRAFADALDGDDVPPDS